MTYKKRTLTSLTLMAISCAAFADQCAWVTSDAASRLEALDKSGQISGNKYIEFCKPRANTLISVKK